MKVEPLKYNITGTAASGIKKAGQTSFTGRCSPLEAASDINMANEIKEFMPSAVKGMKRLSDNMGEIQNIIINALGTGLVAPIFIKWNPLSKTDEDTRTYSAWRQPVSAVLAVATQVGVTIPFNKMIEYRANTGFYDAQYNKTLFQDENFIAKRLKKLYPYATKKQIEAMTKEKMAEQKQNLILMIQNNNVTMSKADGTPVPLSQAKYKELVDSVIQKKIDFENGELKKCNEITIPKKIQRGEYYRTHKDEAKNIFTEQSNKLKNTNDPKVIRKQVKQLIKQHKNGDKELLAIFDEILQRRGNKDSELKVAIQAKLDDVLRDIDFHTKFKTAEALKQGVIQFETESRINPINESLNTLNAMKKMIAENKTVGEIEDFLTQTVDTNDKHRLFKFNLSKDVAKKMSDIVKNNLKAHKQITGLIVSFLMLPISCSLLNWCYPRFMDIFFPNLSSKKHPKEIKDLVNKANNHNMEVKS